MIRVGITGQTGFIGSHLFNFLKLKKDIELIRFDNIYFDDLFLLENFVKNCDVIIHLAAVNRHHDPNLIFETNIELVKKLINALENAKVKPKVLFSSSTQEERDNPYGNSKRIGRELLQEWALRNNSEFIALIVPNVFGPFGKPFYNSVISTFSYQLINNLEPKIEIDANLKLIYINDLVNIFYNLIVSDYKDFIYYVPHSKEIKVSDILKLINKFKDFYINQNIIPYMSDSFERDLFNTFRSYIDIKNFYPVYLKINSDNRGYLVELIKENSGGQIFYSVTKPKITRGNHFHLRKIERFCVINGKAEIKLRRVGTSEIITFIVSGENPSVIDMPIWYTHNITNIGNEELVTLFWSNEIFNPEDPDTYYEEV
jgi:UDP-2-acetamido-2,6-beta-L-arabino-hexul-4-ose reductase